MNLDLFVLKNVLIQLKGVYIMGGAGQKNGEYGARIAIVQDKDGNRGMPQPQPCIDGTLHGNEEQGYYLEYPDPSGSGATMRVFVDPDMVAFVTVVGKEPSRLVGL